MAPPWPAPRPAAGRRTPGVAAALIELIGREGILPVTPAASGLAIAGGRRVEFSHVDDLDAAATLGIRPEHIEIVGPGAGHFDGVADVVEHLGSDTNVCVDAPGIGPVMVRASPSAPATPSASAS